MTIILFLCIGFLAAVLWIDIKFDWLAVPYRGQPGILPEEVLAPMTYFYRYVTGRPIIVATAMVLIVTALILEIVQATIPSWVAWASLMLFAAAAIRASIQIIPTARRFGKRSDTLEEQTHIAHALLWMHIFAFVPVFLVGVLHVYSLTFEKMEAATAGVLFLSIGFVIAVGWINLKFDLLAIPYRKQAEPLPEEILAAIAYFHRYLRSALELGTAMLIILIILILETMRGSVPGWIAWISLILFVIGMSIPITIIRSGRRLGARIDSMEQQTRLAHGLFPGHLFALIIILLVAALQLYAAVGL